MRQLEDLADVRGHGTLTEADINSAMREIRLALLEADVNFQVVKSFTSAVKERALGADVIGQLNPGQQVIKIVNDELTALMGGAVTTPYLKKATSTIPIVFVNVPDPVGLKHLVASTHQLRCSRIARPVTSSERPAL